MKIAILSTPWIALPPIGYGGTELVVANLTERLVRKGHDVTVFATGDSKTHAKLHYYYQKSLGVNYVVLDNPYHSLLHIHGFMEFLKKEKFDIIHNNMGLFGLFFLDKISTPFVHTLHGAYAPIPGIPSPTIESQQESLLHFKDHFYVSISDHQRTLVPELNYVKTVYNGIRTHEFSFGEKEGDYLAWMGRLSPVKGLPIAIEVAKKAGLEIRIAAHISQEHHEYFNSVIKPLTGKSVKFVGELTSPHEKNNFLKNAKALLFPIQWEEPFGLVMVEALASGTPVIAFDKGSVPEIIENGKNGFIVNDENEMFEALKKISTINRQYCHEFAISKFNTDKMADDYVEAYETVISNFQKTR